METENEAVRRSVVRVRFDASGKVLSYYNDAFDLKPGDIVYVEGKLEGERGRVIDVAYNFRIKVSDYKRVIGKADTDVHGTLHMAGSHFVTFNRDVLPYDKVITWFKAPDKAGDEYVSGTDSTSAALDDLTAFKISPEIYDRGCDYYRNNKVRYLCVDGGHGRAIVEGTKPYELEFDLRDGQIGSLTCSCYCSNTCKHEVALILQLRETLAYIKENFPRHSGYFAAVNTVTFFLFAMDGKKAGSIKL